MSQFSLCLVAYFSAQCASKHQTRARKEQLDRSPGPLTESHSNNLAVTVLYVPHSLDSSVHESRFTRSRGSQPEHPSGAEDRGASASDVGAISPLRTDAPGDTTSPVKKKEGKRGKAGDVNGAKNNGSKSKREERAVLNPTLQTLNPRP